METTSVGCRLCLDPFADNFDSIANLKEQMDKVFQFVIDFKPGCSSTVCQSCSYTVCEFYKYAEKVRVNQEWLAGETVEAYNSLGGDFKTVLIPEDVKPEPTIPSSIAEVVQDEDDTAHADNMLDVKEEPKVKPANDQAASDDSHKPLTKTKAIKTARKRRRRSKTPSSDDSDTAESEDDGELRPKRKRKKIPKTQEERDQEDQSIKEFYRMKCDICSYVGEDFKSLLQHFSDEHKRKGFVVCCKKKLFARQKLLNHVAFHKNPNAFRCDQCNKGYKNLEYLALHKSNVHGQGAEHPFKCDECSKTFMKKYQLTKHKESHQTFQCEICNKILLSSVTFNAHMTNMHSEKNRAMVCHFCGQEFLNKQFFDRHLNEHNGIEVPKFQCQFCQKWYRGERNLQNHIEYVHNQKEKGAQFPCDICHQNYPNLRTMKNHKRMVHVEEKFECEFCGRKFKHSYALREHRATHTGEVLYSCDFCGITKNSRANLYVHVKQKHPAEWIERKRQQAQANATS